MTDLQYIIDKINNSQFIEEPFRHLEIKDFLSEEHLNLFTNDKQIHFSVPQNSSLKKTFFDNHYNVIPFPGCTVDEDDYFARLELDKWDDIKNKNNAPENPNNEIGGFGIAYRLQQYHNSTIKKILDFMNSELFKKTLERKFLLKKETNIISAVQKYLTKYEISPHADLRKKALTYLLNINKNEECEHLDIHTHLLKFKKEYEYIYDIWKEKKYLEKVWVPWSWCESVKQIKKNNTMIIFSPDHRSLHGVNLNYDHTHLQRTQVYGNLMYKSAPNSKRLSYRSLIKEDNNQD
tara:strand:- start:1041 stop:1916 length:876 start_codon:yes stop_codon:yes gene_type:complete